MPMKALVLAGGRGNRLGKITSGTNKCLLELYGQPIVEHVLERASTAGINDVVMVVGYRGEDIINRYGISYAGMRIQYVIQTKQLGIVHAIECAADALQGQDFLLMLGDVFLVVPRCMEMLAQFRDRHDVFAYCGVLRVADPERIRKTFTVATKPDGSVIRLVEKPRRPFNDMMGTGEGVFRNAILQYSHLTPPSIRNQERELTDLVQCVVDDGYRVEPFLQCSDYININTEEDLQNVAPHLAARDSE
ncbi:hypothetical protein CDG76_34555 [Nostoc sp. 'Peltigera membranacea cyanobiont' 210A]|uniref:sugar phosphate nucleotidyltransferase n=1 Tax=Nostoc sp. 'Peltigera membranacea cyanobiont' 210A TaxID=2014529 RepID=UPI000B958165|nr:sugar phosphate nucleotidyltransferase [Nostoc sp. 'Peltigera membranacea cyanobiont' 210A]OYD89703.1 hypothetical protein CDG76_34555 [Nostoc sp. 'Peltigera membranacea cyanobiont' 210A]